MNRFEIRNAASALIDAIHKVRQDGVPPSPLCFL
jgi:hypothetical protein